MWAAKSEYGVNIKHDGQVCVCVSVSLFLCVSLSLCLCVSVCVSLCLCVYVSLCVSSPPCLCIGACERDNEACIHEPSKRTRTALTPAPSPVRDLHLRVMAQLHASCMHQTTLTECVCKQGAPAVYPPVQEAHTRPRHASIHSPHGEVLCIDTHTYMDTCTHTRVLSVCLSPSLSVPDCEPETPPHNVLCVLHLSDQGCSHEASLIRDARHAGLG